MGLGTRVSVARRRKRANPCTRGMLGATGNLTWNIILLSRRTGYLVRPADHLALDVEARLNQLAYGSPEEVILDVFLPSPDHFHRLANRLGSG